MRVPAWLLVVLVLGATYRATRLVTTDVIFGGLRRALIRLDGRRGPMEPGEVGRWTYFITCPWCVSVYLGALAAYVGVYWGDNRVVLVVLLALTASAVAGFLGSREE